MSASTALSIREPVAGVTRQRHDPSKPLRKITGTLHQFRAPSPACPSSTTPSVAAPEHAAGERPLYLPELPKTLGTYVSEALWRRINTGAITRKHLQYALGVSAGTIDNLLSGNGDPSGRVLMALLSFFDSAFANEILAPTGCTVAKLSDARAAALRKVAEGMAELQQMEGR
jgi:transcriptional regulator with XRE-family HTH domain